MTLLALLPLALAGGAVRVSPPHEGNCQRPLWSPDASALSYEVNDHERRQVTLHTYSPSEGERLIRPVSRGSSALTAGFTTAPGDQVVHELSWGPGASRPFVFVSSGADRNYELMLAPGTPLAPHPAADGGPAWSPDGAHIVFTSARSGEGDLYLLDTADLSRPPRQLTTSPGAAEVFPAWSPDGRKLAYVEHAEDGDVIRLIDDLDAPRPRTVAALGGTQTRPSFSPDGRSLAWYSDHAARGRFDLYVQPLGGEPRRLAEGVVLNASGPQWTPDGRALVFVLDDDARFDPVLIVDVAGGPARPVPTRTVGNGDHHLVRAPDGRAWLAVAAQGELGGQGSDFRKIYVMALP